MGYISGGLKFNPYIYDVPSIGESIIVSKEFYFYYSGVKNNKGVCQISHKKGDIKVEQGMKGKITDRQALTYGWELEIEFDDVLYFHARGYGSKFDVSYFECRKYLKTKSDLRNDKLSKIGI